MATERKAQAICCQDKEVTVEGCGGLGHSQVHGMAKMVTYFVNEGFMAHGFPYLPSLLSEKGAIQCHVWFLSHARIRLHFGQKNSLQLGDQNGGEVFDFRVRLRVGYGLKQVGDSSTLLP